MKKIKKIALGICTILLSQQMLASAATTTTFQASADVDSTLSMSVVIRQNTFDGKIVDSMNFGSLHQFDQDLGGGVTGSTLRSMAIGNDVGSFVVFASVNSHGIPYVLYQHGQQLNSGVYPLPPGACTFVPLYIAEDNSNQAPPADLEMGVPKSWVGPALIMKARESLVSQIHYQITDDPAAGATQAVPIDQIGGHYQGAITISVVAQ